MLTLYHHDGSVCAQKVRLVLAEKALEWESVHVNLREAEQIRPEYLALNPKGEVPTLVHADKVITESTVIGEYLEDCFPDVELRPCDAYERAQMRIWSKIPDSHIHADTATVSSCTYLRELHLRMSAEKQKEYLDAIPNPDRLRRKVETLEMGTDWPPFVQAVRRFRKLFEDMDAALQAHGKSWLVGDQFTLADIAIAPYATRIDMLGLGGIFADLPHVAGWLLRLQERETFPMAFWDWFEPGYAEMMRDAGSPSWESVASIIELDGMRRGAR